MLFNSNDILETTRMITENKLDVRTITMGISLRDCGHSDMKVTAQKVYDKICQKAENLFLLQWVLLLKIRLNLL